MFFILLRRILTIIPHVFGIRAENTEVGFIVQIALEVLSSLQYSNQE